MKQLIGTILVLFILTIVFTKVSEAVLQEYSPETLVNMRADYDRNLRVQKYIDSIKNDPEQVERYTKQVNDFYDTLAR